MRDAQRYATRLLEELLGPAEIEKRFDWARGDPRRGGGPGVPLPFDAVWTGRRLIIEIDMTPLSAGRGLPGSEYTAGYRTTTQLVTDAGTYTVWSRLTYHVTATPVAAFLEIPAAAALAAQVGILAAAAATAPAWAPVLAR